MRENFVFTSEWESFQRNSYLKGPEDESKDQDEKVSESDESRSVSEISSSVDNDKRSSSVDITGSGRSSSDITLTGNSVSGEQIEMR